MLVIQRGRNRLELAAQVREARIARRALQRGLGLGVALTVVVDKVHRAPQHGMRQRLAGVGLAAAFEFPEKQHQDVIEAQALAVDCRVLVHQPAAQQALERAQQAAFGAGQIGLHRLGTVQHGLRFAGKKQGGGHLGTAAGQRHHLQATLGVDPGRRRVGGAEVDAQHQRPVAAGGAVRGAFQQLVQAASPSTWARKAEMSVISRGCRLCGIG